MKKSDNDWVIGASYSYPPEPDYVWKRTVVINGEKYNISEENAALCHALLLLVDAINDRPHPS
jgi:hypothetical protein